MSRVQQSTSGGWHYPGVNFSQSPQQRPPPAQQQQYYSQPPSAPQYPRQQQGQRAPYASQYPPLQSYGQPQSYAAPSYQQVRGHAPANSNGQPSTNHVQQRAHPSQHPPTNARPAQSWDPRNYPQSSFPPPATPSTNYVQRQNNTPIRTAANTAPSYSPQRSNSYMDQRGRPLPSPSVAPSGFAASPLKSPGRPQSMPPPPVHPRSPQASHFQQRPSYGHTPSHSFSQTQSRGASPSRSPIPYAPPPQHPRSRSLSPTKPHSPLPSMSMNGSPTPARRALPHSPMAPPDLSQLQRTMSNAGAAGLVRRGTVSEMASRFAGSSGSNNATVLPRSSFSYQSPAASTIQPRVDVNQQRQIQQTNIPQDISQFNSALDQGYESADTQSISSMARSQSPVSTMSGSSLDADDENEVTSPDSPTSPQYGIRDLPKRGIWQEDKEKPTSPQYGILDLPRAAELQRSRSSVSDRKRVFEQSSSQAQRQSPRKLEMPPMRQPQPSRSERQPSWTFPSADLNKHGKAGQTSQQQSESPSPIQTTPRKQVTPASMNNTPKAHHNHSASAPPIIPPMSPRKTQSGPNSHLSMALRLAARELEEERGLDAVPPGYRGIGDDIDVYPPEPVLAPKPSVPALTFTKVSTHRMSSTDPPPLPARSSPSSAVSSPTKPGFYAFTRTSSRPSSVYGNGLNQVLDEAPPPALSRSLSRSTSRSRSRSSTSTIPVIQTPEDDLGGVSNVIVQVPTINLPGADENIDPLNFGPSIVVSSIPNSPIRCKPIGNTPSATVPTINFPGDEEDHIARPAPAMPIILTDLASAPTPSIQSPTKSGRSLPQPPTGRAPPGGSSAPGIPTSSSGSRQRVPGASLVCGACAQPIFGRIVSAMGTRWHPECFKCCVCSELLEHVSAYERDGRAYCHLDYHEHFAPQCYHCKTPIVDERFITLDDPALGKRTYHEQHFFCAECGDPFLAPAQPKPGSSAALGKNQGITIHGDGAFDLEDDVGFTVFKGHPYCETCHVRLRAPKCRGCGKSIREGVGYEMPMDDDGRRGAIEALGGKWHWECFMCSGCAKPFDEPSFFQRDKKAYCEPCFSILLRNEI